MYRGRFKCMLAPLLALALEHDARHVCEQAEGPVELHAAARVSKAAAVSRRTGPAVSRMLPLLDDGPSFVEEGVDRCPRGRGIHCQAWPHGALTRPPLVLLN